MNDFDLRKKNIERYRKYIVNDELMNRRIIKINNNFIDIKF